MWIGALPMRRVPVLCVHGLSRQGRDFDYLAADARRARDGASYVRTSSDAGRSGRLRNPNEYALPQYCADMNALVARLGAEEVDFVGTSLGGLIGIVLAGMPGNFIRRLVINDIGPFLPWQGLARIGTYLSDMPRGVSRPRRGRRLLSGRFWLLLESWRTSTGCRLRVTVWRGMRAESVTSCSATRKSSAPFAIRGTTASTSGNTGRPSSRRSSCFEA